ncbi:hypothetical protein LAZ67_1003804 [Cordylochernes scorpioides]|uniref:Uncharacterized protein n=1 Tax=Cordylochernes scorpioides TaxID=51811 RepID=A0ABY6JYT7_9ARAC|nr:hypothetical protein LAZ67_1003804 [Cordylochernes scorpioides]
MDGGTTLLEEIAPTWPRGGDLSRRSMEMSTPANSTNLAILGLHPSAYKVRRTPRSGRPVTATDNAAVAAVRNVVEADRRVTIDEIIIRLPPGIEIRRSSIGTIMSDRRGWQTVGQSSWRRRGEGISRAQLVPEWKEAGRPAGDWCVPRRLSGRDSSLEGRSLSDDNGTCSKENGGGDNRRSRWAPKTVAEKDPSSGGH